MKFNIDRAQLLKPDAILFDTDNTLYAYAPAHEAAQNAVRDKVMTNFKISAAVIDEVYIRARKDVKDRLGQTAASHSRLLYFQRMLELLGLGSQVLHGLDLEQTYWRTFLRTAVLFEHVTELLDDVRLMGIPTAIVTDLTAQIQFRKMVYFGLDDMFDYIVTSEESGADKPQPASFELAIEKLRLVEPNVWMVGDNPVADIKGSRDTISATTFHRVDSRSELSREDAAASDVVFYDFGQLRDVLASVCGAHRPD